MADPGFPLGGCGPRRGGMDSQGGYVSKILYVKTKESGPLGGRAPGICQCRSANDEYTIFGTIRFTKLSKFIVRYHAALFWEELFAASSFLQLSRWKYPFLFVFQFLLGVRPNHFWNYMSNQEWCLAVYLPGILM